MKRGYFKKKSYAEVIEKARVKSVLKVSQRTENVCTAKLKPKTRKSKVKKLSTSKLKKKLDEVFSKYIRQKYADKEGFCSCYTCGARKHWKEIQCGHFVSRQHLATRFDERNVRPQCVGCNIFGNGRTNTFALNLESENGGISLTLYRESHKIVKDFPYQEKIDYYQSLLETESKL